MNKQTQIPSEIAAIIEQKERALLEAKKQQEEAQQRALEEAQLQGQIKFNEYLQAAILQAPEWIRPYLDLQYQGGPDFDRIAKGWDRVENISLFFRIPGLAEIEFNPKNAQWRSQRSVWNRSYDDSEPDIDFNNSSYWRSDIEYVLGEARNERRDYEEYLKEYAVQLEERAKRAEAYMSNQQIQEAEQAEVSLRSDLKHQQEHAEELALFDAIKSDPIALNMLKAFVLLNDERSAFREQLENADFALYNIEERWSRRSEELRRQADEAERQAADEKSRLQSDLDDAESKLKKAQRGW